LHLKKIKPARCETIIEVSLLIMVFLSPVGGALAFFALLVAVFFWIYKMIISKEIKLVPAPLNYPIFIFVLVGFCSIFFSTKPLTSFAAWIILLTFSLTYFLIVNNLKSRKQLERIIKALVIATTLVAVIGIIQYYTGLGVSYRLKYFSFDFLQQGYRVKSTMSNPNILAGLFVLAIPLSLSLLLGNYKKLHYASKTKTIGKDILMALSALAMILCLIFTYSRGGWIGLLGALLIFGWLKNKKFFILFLLSILLSTVLIGGVRNRLESLTNIYFSSNIERLYGWQSALKIIKDHPFFGCGLNTFQQIYPQYMAPQAKEMLAHAHNTFLQIGAEMGLIALGIFIWIFFTLFSHLWYTFKNIPERNLNIITLGVFSGFVGFFIHSQFDVVMDYTPVGLLLWSLMGIAMVLGRFSKNSKTKK